MNKHLILSVVAITFVVSSLGLVGVYAVYLRDIHSIRERLAAGSQVVNTPCGPIEYATWGSGRPVLIFHATGGSYDQALLMGKLFVGEGYQWIAPSRFGHLRTPQAADHSAEAQADMFACLLDALKIDRAALLGMSAGGPIATQFALRHPERTEALILLSTAGYFPPASGAERKLPVPDFVYDALFKSDFVFWMVVRMAGNTLKASFGATPELQASIPAEDKAFLDAMIEGMLPIRMHKDGLENDGEIADTSFLTKYPLEQIAAPTLIIYAKDDTIAVPASSVYAAEHIPNAQLGMYDGGGHALLGNHADIYRRVRALLAQLETAAR